MLLAVYLHAFSPLEHTDDKTKECFLADEAKLFV